MLILNGYRDMRQYIILDFGHYSVSFLHYPFRSFLVSVETIKQKKNVRRKICQNASDTA